MKKDIVDRKDIELMVNFFYSQLLKNEGISYIFSDVDWKRHLPIMYDFWENAIFHTGNYIGHPLKVHQTVHDRLPFSEYHFAIWEKTFNHIIDELFSGERAELAKQRASGIATIMKLKLFFPT